MTKKELEKKREMLIRELKKEEEKKKVAEQNLSMYVYDKQPKDVTPKTSSASAKPKSTSSSSKKRKKSKAKRKSSAKKPVAKKVETVKKIEVIKPIKETPAPDVKKKHVIVSLNELKDYDFEQRKKDWHSKSGINKKQEICSVCKDDDNWETILLENGKHICYYCWIKKPEDKKEPSKPAPIPSKGKDEKVDSSKKTDKKSNSKEPKSIELKADEKALVKVEDQPAETSEQPGKLFYAVSIVLGILLIGLIVVLALGIISGNFDFKFN